MFQCLVECEMQSLQFICMRKFRNESIQVQRVNASYCYNVEIPTVDTKTRLCQSSNECVFETDNDFGFGMLALIIILSLMLISIVTVVINYYFSHFIHLCLKQLYH